MGDFNPLEMYRTIALDEDLTTTQAAVLWGAIFHTDNDTGKVKASQALIAKRAKTSVKTVERVMRDDWLTGRYFANVQRGRRESRAYVDAWWRDPKAVAHRTESPVAEASEESHRTESPNPPDSVSEPTGQRVRTSTSLYSSSTYKTPTTDMPSTAAMEEEGGTNVTPVFLSLWMEREKDLDNLTSGEREAHEAMRAEAENAIALSNAPNFD